MSDRRDDESLLEYAKRKEAELMTAVRSGEPIQVCARKMRDATDAHVLLLLADESRLPADS